MTPPCDTCGEPCQGGVSRYVDAAGRSRIGCTDEHACAWAFGQLTATERRDLSSIRTGRTHKRSEETA